MNFVSTRGGKEAVKGTVAVIKGLADNGGLYTPASLPKIDLKKMLKMSYMDICAEILCIFFPELSNDAIIHIVNGYNRKFEGEIVSIATYGSRSFLELYHGPTASFKDMALTLLPEILKESYKIEDKNERILVLTATSGDTGSAAMEGFSGVDNTDIVVFYPNDGISIVQMAQMESANKGNAHVFAVRGNFDDAQRAVKMAFSDVELNEISRKNSINITSANSINVGRLISQIGYYFYSYYSLLRSGVIKYEDKIDVSVPTGNFGNILAGIFAKQMGLPIDNFICASNANDVLTQFIKTRRYVSDKTFHKTLSPSMDILVSSNLERFLFLTSRGNGEMVRAAYDNLQSCGEFEWGEELPEYIHGVSVNDEETLATILEVYNEKKYLIDPHTAVAYKASNISDKHCLIISTASPYKFPKAVLSAIGGGRKYESEIEELQAIEELSKTKIPNCIFSKLDYTSPKEIIDKDKIINKIKEIMEK
ncbi:MAG: threonine synthase [Tissierellia bacterium]|nr:threonine synthase [Tissierellia bacterium]